ncbi:hypothetical protein AAG570_004823 [Ranatra chinensis]|uniref:Uncharacterized protein n=1 Tax=Ranatra chinensis TaxID=642074 RepID=A0ABD0XYY9_9HEMI
MYRPSQTPRLAVSSDRITLGSVLPVGGGPRKRPPSTGRGSRRATPRTPNDKRKRGSAAGNPIRLAREYRRAVGEYPTTDALRLTDGRRDSPPVHRDRQHDGGRLAARKIRGWPRHGTELGSRRRSAAHLAQARHVDTAPLPDQARLATIPRANPYPEVTDPICRLPLPTLFYRLEAIHLGDLLRIWVRAGAVFLVALSRIFKVRGGRSGHRRNSNAYREETTLPGSPGGVSGSFWVTPTSSRKREPDSNGSAAGFRNRNRIPFRPTGASETLTSVLGSTDSCATAVHKKPFSTSVLQGLAGVFATTTKICAGDGSRRALAQTLLRTSPRPSYSSRPNGASPDERGPPDLPLTAEYRHDATAPSIFRASRFGR